MLISRSIDPTMPASVPSTELIRLRDVSRAYETRASRTDILSHVHFAVREGEFVTIMGPSGAGKSTLLSILGFLDHGWTGDYWFLDHQVHRLKPKQRMDLSREYVGFVFQQYHLLDDLTVAENLDVPLSYRNVPRSERQARVAEVLDRFQIVAKKDLFPNQLSGGQQQLIGVARAVIGEPKVILADEPTGSLHSSQGREIMELFRRLNDAGTTIVQVTHNEEWAEYGHRIVELHDGRIVSERPTGG
jgi:putative ABC transport system ATP-binding protein